jgi:hypothetical protein
MTRPGTARRSSPGDGIFVSYVPIGG